MGGKNAVKQASFHLFGLLVLLQEFGVRAEDSAPDDPIGTYGFLLWFPIMCITFWALAVVVEEFFVPALNVLCEVIGMPDDVAGATFMAAGASSPEMFAAFVSLFITKTSLGIGTIIGSEIFNHLCICAGSILYSKTGVLVLDARILARDVAFYALAIAGLLYCESSTRRSNDDDDDEAHIYIHWYQPLVLLCGYGVYVLVCAYYFDVVKLFCPRSDLLAVSDSEDTQSTGPSSDDGDRNASFTIFDEPAENFANAVPEGLFFHGDEPTVDAKEESHMISPQQSHRDSFVDEIVSAATHQVGLVENLSDYEAKEDGFHCFLWKKSRLYSKMRVSSKAWQLRWVTIDRYGFRSCRDRRFPNEHVRAFNVYQATKVEPVDRKRLIFKLYAPSGNLEFQAPTREVFGLAIRCLREHLQFYGTMSGTERSGIYKQALSASTHAERLAVIKENPALSVDEENAKPLTDQLLEDLVPKTQKSPPSDFDDDEEDAELLIEWPKHGGIVMLLLHIILFPVKAMLYLTIPDVRFQKRRDWYLASIFSSVAWLAILSYVMSYSVELLAGYIGMDLTVAGLTISAAGTSFPNVFASMLVARQGLGNMSVSNAFGSNVFNVFVGLGLPWILYCLFGSSEVDSKTKTYHGLTAEGVVFPTVLLFALLIGFIIILIITDMRLYKIHAYGFILLYIGFLIWAVGWKCKAPF